MNKFIELTGVVDGKVRLFNVNNISAIHRHGEHSAVELVGVSEYHYVVKKSYEEVKAMLFELDSTTKFLGREILSVAGVDFFSSGVKNQRVVKDKERRIVELVEHLGNHMHDNGYTTDASKIQLLKTMFNEREFNRLFRLIAKYRVE